jgi:prepilin-type N-terminal cleavage/methylation domain-containing protein
MYIEKSAQHKRQKGFTLIELITVVVIITTLFVIVLANYRSGQLKQAIVQAEKKLISDLRRAQNMAISGTSVNNQYYGYGIYMDIGSGGNNKSYIIYGEKEQGSQSYNQGVDVIIETIALPEKTIIQEVSSANQKLGIFFEPPDPKTYIDSSPQSNQATIILRGENDAH